MNKCVVRVFLLFLLAESSMSQTQEPVTKQIMVEFMNTIKNILPLSLQGDEFEKKKNQSEIARHLQNFSKQAEKLEAHFLKTRSREYSYIAQSIARDARAVHVLYLQKEYHQARFIVHHITQNCVSCHLKEPARNSNFAPGSLFASLNSKNLDGFDLAHFKVMTRQFTEAEELYEKTLLADKKLDMTALSEYLKVAIRVNLNLDGVSNMFTQLLTKPFSQTEIKMIKKWHTQLLKIKQKKLLNKITLTNGQRLLLKDKADLNFGDEMLINKLVASSVLHRLLNQKKLKKQEISQVYYLLGKAEEALADSFWLSEIENYLEQSIRSDPGGQWSKKSYKLLQEQYIFGYTGSSGSNLPQDINQLLSELRKIAGLPKDINVK